MDLKNPDLPVPKAMEYRITCVTLKEKIYFYEYLSVMQLISNYTNVFFDPGSKHSFEQLHEKEYLLKILEQLRIKLGQDFKEFSFIVFSANGSGYTPASGDETFQGKKKVLFYISDEMGTTAEELQHKYYRIFKSYLPYNSNNNIYPFPLGHVDKIHFRTDEIMNINARKYNVFFSGNLNKSRAGFFKQFSSSLIPAFLLKYLIKFRSVKHYLIKKANKENTAQSYINFTTGFKQGLSPEEYKELMLNSKIAFCPRGFRSAETFRHLEAMSAGCIVISEKLPDNFLYRDCPIIQVTSWDEAIPIIKKLLENPAVMEQLQQKTIHFWENNYSDTAIAEFIKTYLYN